jgi:hypothetical protein
LTVWEDSFSRKPMNLTKQKEKDQLWIEIVGRNTFLADESKIATMANGV